MKVNWNQVKSFLINWFIQDLKGKSIDSKLNPIEIRSYQSISWKFKVKKWNQLKTDCNRLTSLLTIMIQNCLNPGPSKLTSLKRPPPMFGGCLALIKIQHIYSRKRQHLIPNSQLYSTHDHFSTISNCLLGLSSILVYS